MRPATALRNIAKKYSEIADLREIVDKALKDKLGDGFYLQHNEADGLVILFNDEANTPISSHELNVLLSSKVSREEAIEYIKSKSI